MIRDRRQSDRKGRFKRGAKLLAEAAAALLLVLLFFAGFLALLERLFPTGTTFRQLVDRQSGGALRERIATDGEAAIRTGGGASEEAAAVLSATVNEVKSKRSTSIAWGPAVRGMPLYNRDAVQTLRASGATITFDRHNYLKMGSNSLVIIRQMENDRFLNERRSVMVMVEGELRGRLTGTTEQGMHLEIATPEALTRIRSDRPGQGAEFRITVNPDQSSSVVVLAGQAEITAQGVTVKVGAQQGVTVQPGEKPAAPLPLPAPPPLREPAQEALFPYRQLPPRVRFAWDSAPSGKYRFQLAADPAFASPLVDQVLSGAEFVHGNLRPGTYYWRVAALRGGCEGKPGAPRAFTLEEDRTPPTLQVLFPEESRGERLLLTGTVEPGCRLFIGGMPVPAGPGGEFSREVPLSPGINSVLVEAVDAAGNVTYRRGLIQRQP